MQLTTHTCARNSGDYYVVTLIITRICAHKRTYAHIFIGPLGQSPMGPDTLYRNVPLAYYGAFQAPSLPIGGLQGPLGTQSVLAIPKGEPPCGLPPWIPHLHH